LVAGKRNIHVPQVMLAGALDDNLGSTHHANPFAAGKSAGRYFWANVSL
jgi:hypothetical protein